MAAIHDSLQTSHYSKAVYRLWRPETAIAHADLDDNPATSAETGWTPLIPTPPYPAYSSNMTCIGTGASRMLADVLGSDAQTFAATWYNAATRSYSHSLTRASFSLAMTRPTAASGAAFTTGSTSRRAR